jgi:hypothetical protein
MRENGVSRLVRASLSWVRPTSLAGRARLTDRPVHLSRWRRAVPNGDRRVPRIGETRASDSPAHLSRMERSSVIEERRALRARDPTALVGEHPLSAKREAGFGLTRTSLSPGRCASLFGEALVSPSSKRPHIIESLRARFDDAPRSGERHRPRFRSHLVSRRTGMVFPRECCRCVARRASRHADALASLGKEVAPRYGAAPPCRDARPGPCEDPPARRVAPSRENRYENGPESAIVRKLLFVTREESRGPW